MATTHILNNLKLSTNLDNIYVQHTDLITDISAAKDSNKPASTKATVDYISSNYVLKEDGKDIPGKVGTIGLDYIKMRNQATEDIPGRGCYFFMAISVDENEDINWVNLCADIPEEINDLKLTKDLNVAGNLEVSAFN